jgi:hypothetical protein
MWHNVTVGFQLESKYYAPESLGTVEVFLPRDQCEPTTKDAYSGLIEIGKRGKLVMRIPSSLPKATPLIVRWSTIRWMDGDGKHYDGSIITKRPPFAQMYHATAGRGFCTIGEAERGAWARLYDSENECVGRIYLIVLDVPERSVELTDSPTNYLTPTEVSAMTKEMNMAINEQLDQYESNIDYLTPCNFTQIQQSVGYVPMWSFTVEPFAAVSSDASDTERLFIRMAVIAACDMYDSKGQRVDISNTTDPATMAEFIAKILLFFTRHMLYVKDSSKRNGTKETYTDDWMQLGHARHPASMGFDCEDGTSMLTELCMLFNHAKFTDPILQRLQAFDKQYIFMWCIGAIRSGGSNTYHSFGMKIGLGAFFQFERGVPMTSKGVPNVLYETTTESTSCWAYDIADRSAKDRHAAGYITKPIEPNIGCPAQVTVERNLYRHLVVAFAPHVSVARMDFLQNGKIGASIEDIMFNRLSNIKALVTETTDKDLGNIKRMYMCAQRLAPIRCGLDLPGVITTLTASETIPTTRPYYDLAYRTLDYTPSLLNELLLITRGSACEVTKLQPTKTFSGVRVKIWK